MKGLTSRNRFVIRPFPLKWLTRRRLRCESACTSFCQFQSSDHSTLPLYLSVWGFVTEPTQRSEIILFLLYYYLFKIFHRFWLSPVPSLNPYNRHMVTIFGGRYRQYPIDGMLILDLHNSSHHTQPDSIIVQYMKYLWLNKVLNRRGKLWTCLRHVKAGVEKSSNWSRANHYIIHDIFTIITFNPENWFL